MKKLMSLVLCISALVSCIHSEQKQSVLKIDIQRPNPVPDILDKYHYITLETSDESLIGEIKKIVIQNDKLYVLNSQSTIKVFDDKGKFLSGIDKKGRGPGEYIEISDFQVLGNNIYVLQGSTRPSAFTPKTERSSGISTWTTGISISG